MSTQTYLGSDAAHFRLDPRYATDERNAASDMRSIGILLRRRRKELGYTQEEIAEHLHYSPRLIGEIERGRGSVGIERVLRLASVLGIDPVMHVRGK